MGSDRFEPAPSVGMGSWLLAAFVPASIASDLFLGSNVDEALRGVFVQVAATKYLVLVIAAALAWIAGIVRRRIARKHGNT